MTKSKQITKAIKQAGPVIGAKELKKIEEKYGSKAVTQAREYAKETPNVKFNEKAQKFYQDSKNTSNTSVPTETISGDPVEIKYPTETISGVPGTNLSPQYIDVVGGSGIPAGRYSEQEYGTLSAGILAKLAGDIEIEKEQVRGLYTTRQQEISSAATKYGYDRDLEAKKYIADQDLLKNTRVAEIEGQKRIDLQSIINAGLKDIEGIRGQTERDVETLRGEFGVKQESERQRGQKDIARIGSEAGFRNALIGAFSF
jgi:hypothetical protein